MAVFNYICKNPGCTEFEVKCTLVQFREDDVKRCERCHSELERLFPSRVSIKSSTGVNNQPVGKVIQEKNDKLKEKWGAYSHEEKSLKESITKMAEGRSK